MQHPKSSLALHIPVLHSIYFHLHSFSPHQVPRCPETENNMKMVLCETSFKAAARESRKTHRYPQDHGFLGFRLSKLAPLPGTE